MNENSSPILILLLNNIICQPCLSCTLFQHFKKYKTPAAPCFSISTRLKTQPYLIFQHFQWKETQLRLILLSEQYDASAGPQPDLLLAFQTILDRSHTPFQHFQFIKTPNVTHFSVFNRIKPQQNLILAISIKEKAAVSCFCFLNNIQLQQYLSYTLFLLFEQYNTPAAPQSYFILEFSNTQDPNRTLFQHFEQIKSPVITYFSVFNRKKPQQHLDATFLLKEHPSFSHTLAVAYFNIFSNIRPHLYLISGF